MRVQLNLKVLREEYLPLSNSNKKRDMVCAITNNLHDIKKPKHTELLSFVILFVILKHTILKKSIEMVEPEHDSESILS